MTTPFHWEGLYPRIQSAAKHIRCGCVCGYRKIAGPFRSDRSIIGAVQPRVNGSSSSADRLTHAPPRKAACRSDVSARAGSVRHDAGRFAPGRAKCAPPSLHHSPLTWKVRGAKSKQRACLSKSTAHYGIQIPLK